MSVSASSYRDDDEQYPNDPDEFMAQARDRYTEAVSYDAEDVASAKEDVDFLAGKQWDDDSIELRNAAGKRPVLTWNRLHTFVQQVSNDGRQNKPSIHVTSADGGDPATAQVIQSRIRQIEYESDADVAYDTAREQQVGCGRGFYRVTTQWDKPPKWRQVIRLKQISNQFSVVFDPLAQEYDKSDAEYCFVDSLYSISKYKKEFGINTPLAQADFYDNAASDWIKQGPNKDKIRIAEYWLKEYKPRTLVELKNGDSAWKDELPDSQYEHIQNEREELDCTVCQYIIDGISVLKKTEFLVPYIPIVPQFGRQEVVKGKLRNISLGRYAKDAQKLVNLYVSNIAEQIGQMPKTPYVGYEGQFDEHIEEWEDLNNIPRAYVTVKPVTDRNGNVLPLPRREMFEPPVQALTVGLMQAVDALKAACNIYDASLGAAPPDASGLAIENRNKESDNGNFHFLDNEARSRKYAGRIILALIRKLDATQDSIQVRSEDGKTSSVKLNQPVRHSDGRMVTHNLQAGDYEPHIFTGPSNTSARQEASRFYANLAQQDKNFMQIGGDILFRNMDTPGAQELSERYKKMLPPQLQDATDPAQLQGKLQNSMQMIQQLSQTVHKLQDQIDSQQIENQTKLRITEMQEETKRQNISVQAAIAEANLGVKSGIAQLQAQVDAIQHSMDHVRAQDEADFDALLDHYANMGADIQQQQEQQQSTGTDGQQ